MSAALCPANARLLVTECGICTNRISPPPSGDEPPPPVAPPPSGDDLATSIGEHWAGLEPPERIDIDTMTAYFQATHPAA